MIKTPLFPVRLVGREIVTPDGLILATVGPLIHPDHAQQLVYMINSAAQAVETLAKK